MVAALCDAKEYLAKQITGTLCDIDICFFYVHTTESSHTKKKKILPNGVVRSVLKMLRVDKSWELMPPRNPGQSTYQLSKKGRNQNSFFCAPYDLWPEFWGGISSHDLSSVAYLPPVLFALTPNWDLCYQNWVTKKKKKKKKKSAPSQNWTKVLMMHSYKFIFSYKLIDRNLPVYHAAFKFSIN
jgi:hypothetical protein